MGIYIVIEIYLDWFKDICICVYLENRCICMRVCIYIYVCILKYLHFFYQCTCTFLSTHVSAPRTYRFFFVSLSYCWCLSLSYLCTESSPIAVDTVSSPCTRKGAGHRIGVDLFHVKMPPLFGPLAVEEVLSAMWQTIPHVM